MIIGNVKSHEDLRKKKQLQQDLLAVEVANEAEMEKRVKDFKNPYVAKPVPPKYKTRAELMRDVMGLTDSLISKFKDIDIPYDIAKGAIMEFSNDPDSLAKLNALFPSIRRKILEATIPSLLTSEMILDIAKPILRRSELAYGFTIDKPSFKSAQELESIYGIEEELAKLKNKVVSVYGKSADGILQSNSAINTETSEAINQLIEIYPDREFFEKLDSPDISEDERHRYFSELEEAFHSSGIPTMEICHKLSLALDDAIGKGPTEINQSLKAIRRAMSNATPAKLSNLDRTIERIRAQVEGAKDRQERKLDRRHIEQFGEEGARARARAQGESESEGETEDEREEMFDEEGKVIRDLRDIRRGTTPEEQKQEELRAEAEKLRNVKNQLLRDEPITRDQRQYVEYYVSLMNEAIRQFGSNDMRNVNTYMREQINDNKEIERLVSILPPQQLQKCEEILMDIMGRTFENIEVRGDLQGAITEEEDREIEDRRRRIEAQKRARQQERTITQEGLANIGRIAKERTENRKFDEREARRRVKTGLVKPPPQLVLDPLTTREGTQVPLAHQTILSKKQRGKLESNLSQKQYKEYGEYTDENFLKSTEADLFSMDIEKISGLKPKEKKVFRAYVRENPISLEEEEDDEPPLSVLRERIGVSGMFELPTASQEKVGDALEVREDIADEVGRVLGEAKPPSVSVSEVNELVEIVLDKMINSILEEEWEKAVGFLAEAKAELETPYADDKPASKAKPKPPPPPPEARAEAKPEGGKKGKKAEAKLITEFASAEELPPEEKKEKSAKKQAIIKQAGDYFDKEFLPELMERTDEQRRALIRNIIIKILADTGRRFSDVLSPLLFELNEPLSKAQERNLLGQLRIYYLIRQEEEGGAYTPNAKGKAIKGKPSESNPPLKKGLGVKKRKPRSVATKHHEEDLESESSSDEEEKPQKKPLFKASRIKVGKGIEVVEEPKYRSFGKYVIHIPQLHNNKLNLKYPKSLGTIPSIKPTPISEEYRDFILDVLDNGKMSEKELKRLIESEQKHFEKIVNGAGLVETFKLKKTISKDEKEEADRFNLLRGEYLAGNNAPTLLKELRSFILKFMDDGRIKRKDGMGLLAELAVSV